MPGKLTRRNLVKKSVAVSVGAALGLGSFEEKHLVAQISKGDKKESNTQNPTGKMTYGEIKHLKISRLFCGGNLIGGWAHSRDLMYVSPLIKAYHTTKKVFETLELAEELGINTILTNPVSGSVINRYWNEIGGTIQWISECVVGKNSKEGIKRTVDSGAHAVYVQGAQADLAVMKGTIDKLGEALEYIRELGVPGGLGAHDIKTVKACVKAGLDPDFWVKTIHSHDYWSATPKEIDTPFVVMSGSKKEHDRWHDNMYCRDIQGTIEYMNTVKKPWIGFKVLAAGAIHPRKAFKFALESGADFICAGMFDFQIREDVIIAKDTLSGDLNRQRPWRA